MKPSRRFWHTDLALEESEERLRALVEASPLGINILDLDGRPVFYNPRCEELHGIPFSQAGGKGWEKAVHPDDRERIVESWYAAARARQGWSETYRFLHPNGRVVWVIGRTAPMFVRGELIGHVGTLEDITEHKEAEAERERLLEREQAARRQAEAATLMRDNTLASVAHELRTPLQAIAMSVEALRLTTVHEDEQSHGQLTVALRNVAKMSRLVEDLLDISQLEAGTFEIRPEPITLLGLLDETLETFEPKAKELGIALSCEAADGLPSVSGDRQRLAQVLFNLVDNALKFTPQGGQVAVRAQPSEGQVRITVEDTGPGIPAELTSKVFDSFWQADRATRAGAGLGLGIAKGIVEAHGGAIWVEGNGGAKFHFTLPSC